MLRNRGSYSGCPLHLQELTAFAKKPKEKVTERRYLRGGTAHQLHRDSPLEYTSFGYTDFPFFQNSSNSKLIHPTSLYNAICDLTPKEQQIGFFP